MLARYGVQNGSLARRAYQDVTVQTATPGQILLRLHEGAIRFTRQAQEAIRAKKPSEKGLYITKVMAIIDQLNMALDHQAAPEMCANLERLYVFLLDQLNEANVKMDPAPLDVVLQHLTMLHETWRQAVSQTGG